MTGATDGVGARFWWPSIDARAVFLFIGVPCEEDGGMGGIVESGDLLFGEEEVELAQERGCP